MIVVDSNVLAYFHLPGPFTARAEALFAKDPDWAVPILWRSEFRNILAGHMRRDELGFDDACRLQQQADALLAGAEYQVDSRDVLTLIRDSGCSAYDCEYVALAMHLDTRLVTMDKQLIREFPKRVVGLASAVG